MILNLNPDDYCQYYYYVGIFATLLFIIKLIIYSLTGGDSEVMGDFNTEMDTDTSFDFFSIQSVIAFFMGFGWMGYAGIKQFEINNQLYNLLIAIGVGFVFMLISSTLMFLAKKLEKNVKKDKATALNKIGKAYSAFAPKASGQVEIDVNGQLSVVEAINTTDEEIKSFENVRVVEVKDDILYIEKVN